MTKLGVPPNDKGQEPSTSIVFSGIRIDTIAGTFSVDEEQREYVIQRISDILLLDHCSRKDLESINGSLGWLCFVIHHGRCRRDVIQKACSQESYSTPISRPLRKQLRWWLDLLQRRAFRPSRIWFRDEIQHSLRIQSDASGDHGFGFCAAGFHVTGCWRPELTPIIQHDMFVKELIPVTIAILLFHTVLPSFIFGPALDNAGLTSRINCGSCRSPLGRRLLLVIADALWASDSDIISDWNSRDQPLAQHADTLSKILSDSQWADIQNSPGPPWIFDLLIQGRRITNKNRENLHTDPSAGGSFARAPPTPQREIPNEINPELIPPHQQFSPPPQHPTSISTPPPHQFFQQSTPILQLDLTSNILHYYCTPIISHPRFNTI